ncbi:MAG: hypothetical protein WGN25_01060 [Candidatus Electrothrix sp. GW3-4]|uniref:hypothetical protein n=1 Tax=Candidatus Electrothrix sp. GW3-4 TaxID=3126740 RepID=UPI0030D20C30
MNEVGFLIKRLRIVGKGVESAEVPFTTGLNVIIGPSDTGKTYIFQCLDYMLGASKKPKGIPEAKKYTSCLLEIKSYQGDYYTLERSLKGGAFNLYESKIDIRGTAKPLKEDNKGSNESISDFLLKLCNIDNKKVRKNANGLTRNLYFQDLKRYCLIDEERIIEENTPVRSKQYTEKTFGENVFKFLLTGQDDSSIVSLLTKDEVTNKKGKLELLEEIITALKSDLKGQTSKGKLEEQIKKIDDAILSFKKDYSLTKDIFNRYETEKNQLYNQLLQKESRINTLIELLKRSVILERQYESDIARLKATFEASESIENIEIFNCPVCKSDLTNQATVDTESIRLAIKKEIEKTILLKKELKESVKLFDNERLLLIHEKNKLQRSYDELIRTIESEASGNISKIEKQINYFLIKKVELSKIQSLFIELDDFEDKKKKIEAIIRNNKEKGCENNYEKISTSILQPFTELMYSTLKAIKFENLGKSVGFSEDDLDFVIAGKNRKDYGKGYRAILYAIFTITLLEFLKNKPYKIGFILIDSPLNPYKPDESTEGKISRNLANNCYKYLHESTNDQQVIIIENTEPPKCLEEEINFIKFSKENGFIPKQ